MRKRLLSLSVICALSVSAAGYAADDVYVDLSVLDAAPQDSIGFVASQPLFPVYEKPKVKPVRRIKPRKKIEKTVVPPVVKSEPVVKPEPEIKAEPKVTESPAQEEIKPETENVNSIETKDDKTETEIPSADVEKPVTETNVPATEMPQNIEKTAEEIVTEPVAKPVAAEDENKTAVREPEQKAAEPQPSVEPETEQVSSAPVKDEKVEEPAPVVMSATTADLPEVSAVSAPKEVFSISFAPESSELSAEMLQRLEEAARTFDAEQKKKISIKAHNFDNGEDSFRKKRISLMRATEVRSWLLNRGFKNFSIRVVNSSIDEENKDMVEIEELD